MWFVTVLLRHDEHRCVLRITDFDKPNVASLIGHCNGLNFDKSFRPLLNLLNYDGMLSPSLAASRIAIYLWAAPIPARKKRACLCIDIGCRSILVSNPTIVRGYRL